ncbi:hypothetical protein CRM22_007572 [Opisthorchis felineus]|uniref:3'-phosphate/5'-hydroxy nucleic acid ligase n=1 Tax=Opisthorchis felineus TaxID=147828 RepID=A0A4S2LN16_OPIFE|nr:hypothetical protein CRM22_007572 [Opisthorchis felineus]
MPRTYDEELKFLEKITPTCWKIKKGFVPNMNVEGVFYVNDFLEKLMFDELRNFTRSGDFGGFLPGMKQIGNVAALPGIVHGRALSRAKSRRNLDYTDVLEDLQSKGISIRVASPKLVMEEAPESYKNVTDVVNTCQAAGISNKVLKLRPIGVIKG